MTLQFFILSQAFAAVKFEAGEERYNEYLAPYGGLTGRLYADFFTLSTYQPQTSLGSFDFLFNWRLPRIGTPNLDPDIIFTQIAQLTYMFGVLLLVLEKVLDIIMMTIESAVKLTSSTPATS